MDRNVDVNIRALDSARKNVPNRVVLMAKTSFTDSAASCVQSFAGDFEFRSSRTQASQSSRGLTRPHVSIEQSRAHLFCVVRYIYSSEVGPRSPSWIMPRTYKNNDSSVSTIMQQTVFFIDSAYLLYLGRKPPIEGEHQGGSTKANTNHMEPSPTQPVILPWSL